MDAGPTTLILQTSTHNHDQLPETLSPSSVSPSPFDQFRQWLNEALNGSPEVAEPKDMSVATVTANGVPSVRILRLDSFDERGFVFCTSYVSRKSQELVQNPTAALAFHWKESRRQVRIVGRAEKISDEESDEYFKSRPLAARIAAHAVQQSAVIGEEELDLGSAKVKREYGVAYESDEDADIARPESWGGWRVIPREVEFWSGKPDRLHDRVRYLREGESWRIERLAP